MNEYVSMIVSNAKRTHGYAEKLIVGISPSQAARKPRFEGGGAAVTVDTNHPVFVYGHLGIYPARLMTLIGGDPAPLAPPAGWEDLLKAGVECKDDAAGNIYPKWDAVTKHYFRVMPLLIDATAKLSDAQLLMQHPDPAKREAFPTVGHMLFFLLNNHVMMHLGQISAWRRCFGLPAAM